MNTKWELHERSDESVGTWPLTIAALCATIAGIVLLLRLQLLPVSQPELVFRAVLTLTGLTMANLVVFGLVALLQGRSPRQAFVAACLFGLLTNVLFIFLFDRVNLVSWYPVLQTPLADSQRSSEDRIRFRYRESTHRTEVFPTESELPQPVAVVPQPPTRSVVAAENIVSAKSSSQTRVVVSLPYENTNHGSTFPGVAPTEPVDVLPAATKRQTLQHRVDVPQVAAPPEASLANPMTDISHDKVVGPADVAEVRVSEVGVAEVGVVEVGEVSRIPPPSRMDTSSDEPAPRAASLHPFVLEVPGVALPVAPAVLSRLTSRSFEGTRPAMVPVPQVVSTNSMEPQTAGLPHLESPTVLSASETTWEIDALADGWWEDSLEDDVTSAEEEDTARAEMISRIRPADHAGVLAKILPKESVSPGQDVPKLLARRTVTPALQTPNIVVPMDAVAEEATDSPDNDAESVAMASADEPDSAVDKSKLVDSSDQQRFIREEDLGTPDVTTAVTAVSVATDATPFQSRMRRHTDRSKLVAAVDEKTDVAIELGLEYLARCQLPDGSWRFQQGPASTREDVSPSIESGTAATGLALLAFLGAGYHHQADKYQVAVSSGLSYLLDHQADSGDLYVRQGSPADQTVWLYSHAIAAMTVCEAYGMTHDSKLRVPAQRALDFIVSAQHPDLGGWRYAPGVAADTSVSGWMLVALKSGELSGLAVSDAVYDGVRKWLDHASFRPEKPHLFRYNPYAGDSPQQRHGRVPSRAMSAVGMVMSLYLGTSPGDQRYQDGMEQLERFPPQLGTVRAPLRDAYYWYYATLAAYYAGGETWNHWNRALRKILLDAQVQRGSWAGSWDPLRPVPDRWAEHGGRLYVTVMNLLCLEVEYRHLPIYQEHPNSETAPRQQ